MTRAEFRRRLDQLEEVITRGRYYYAVWRNLSFHDGSRVSWSLEEQSRVLGWFKGFFTPVRLALLDMTFMQFAKVFDTDPRTVSLRNLLEAARRDTSLVPGHTAAEVGAVLDQLGQSERMLTGLRQMRNQRLAHADANPLPVDPLRNTELDALVEQVESAFNRLSTAHDGSAVNWEFGLRDAERHTTDVLGILREEMERNEREHQEEMRSVRQSYGLTEEEMHRVQEERGST